MNILRLTESLISDLANVYPEPWKEEPWNEFFTVKEAEKIIQEAFNHKGFVGFVVQDDNEQIIGFTWGYLMSPVELSVHAGWNDERTCETVFYLAELGVLKNFRSEGVGLALSKKLIKEVFNQVVLRTDDIAEIAIALYRKLGFAPLLDSSGKQLTDSNHQSRLYWWLE